MHSFHKNLENWLSKTNTYQFQHHLWSLKKSHSKEFCSAVLAILLLFYMPLRKPPRAGAPLPSQLHPGPRQPVKPQGSIYSAHPIPVPDHSPKTVRHRVRSSHLSGYIPYPSPSSREQAGIFLSLPGHTRTQDFSEELNTDPSSCLQGFLSEAPLWSSPLNVDILRIRKFLYLKASGF